MLLPPLARRPSLPLLEEANKGRRMAIAQSRRQNEKNGSLRRIYASLSKSSKFIHRVTLTPPLIQTNNRHAEI